MELQPNKNKNLIIEVPSTSSGQVTKRYARYPVKTKLITPEDKDISFIVRQYAKGYLLPEDIVFVSEKAVAVTQGRSYHLDSIKPSKMAVFLSKYVTKTPIGIGLGSPQTMQLAIEEVGILRILFSAFFGAIFKVFGVRGVFYILAGDKARSIDGAVPYAIPPYNKYVSKGPIKANKVAKEISEKLDGVKVAIVDANDIGVNILGATSGVDRKFVARAIKDNPLGQTDECTPVGIIREIK
jgi:F420-0:gamma-glutamyl ligase-like protein